MKVKVGTSKVKITPPVGSPLAGYSKRTSFSTGVHDDLFARLLVLDNGQQRVGIASCDLIGVLSETTSSVRSKGEEVGIPESNMMVCAYHTHSGPTPDLGYGNMGRYMSELSARISSAIPEAVAHLGPAAFRWASCEAHGLTANRRDPYNGPTDPELVSLSWTSEEGDAAHLLNFSCHAVVLGPDNTLISADYPGYAMGWIEKRNSSACLFTNGACGDINPKTDTFRARMEKGEDVYDRSGGSFREAEKLGTTLAKSALRSLRSVKPIGDDLLRCTRHFLEVPVEPYAPTEEIAARVAELEERLPELERQGAPPDQLYLTGLEMSLARKALQSAERGSTRAELQGIRIGDVVLLGIPGELFVEIGLKLKAMAESRGYKAIVVELANDYLSYLPTEDAFDKGGYEPEIASRLGYGPQLEGLLLDGAREVLEGLG